MSAVKNRHDHHAPGTLIRHARFYDLFAPVVTLGRARRIREAILTRAALSFGERVLDVGCGTGTLAMEIRKKVGSEGVVHGIDASPEMVALAKEKAAARQLDIGYKVAAAQHLPFEDGSFDAILCTMVMHHLPRDQRADAIAEMFRVLVPGGRALIVDLSREGGLLARMNPIVLLHGQQSLETIREVEDLIRKRGFQEVATGALGFGSLGYVLGRKAAAT
ncbi:MAG TPA: class I SAM-dependent methyltransferase [Longimicrobiaceae bacterium]